MTSPTDPNSVRRQNLALILGFGLLLALVYWPLIAWLVKASVYVSQLSAGAMLVVFAAIVCLQDSLRELRFDPQIRPLGLGLLALGFWCLWLARHLALGVLPTAVFSFCASLAAIIAFLFGREGVRQFLPALVGFLVFGLLLGLFPTLDWPLRAMAARYSGGLLNTLGFPVQLLAEPGQPAELLLVVDNHFFHVATECNGFGLLTSALLLATILGFQYRLLWLNKIGLLAISIPAAIVCNFVRIVSICLVAPRVILPYAVVHETLGVIFYFAGLALVWRAARRARG